MILNEAVALMTQDVLPNQIIFTLNDDKTTYSVDCFFNSVNINGECKSMMIHSDKASYPKYTELFVMTRENENVLFDVIIPDE